MKFKTVVVDLDGTLCEPNLQYEDTERRYGQAKPKLNVIKKLHQLNLHTIIHTSRRMKTHKGDLEKIKKDVEQITKDWLKLHNVKYDELIFGKPYSDTHYIDDKALSVNDFLKGE